MTDKQRPRSLAEWFGFKKPAPTSARASARPTVSYHAVSIQPGPAPCSTARSYAGQRLLSRNAPRLPLPTCDAAHCECRFRHHADRRAGPRRRIESGLSSGPYSGEDRRRRGGRRKEDFSPSVW